MGVLPFQFLNGQTAKSLQLKGDEIFTIRGVEDAASIKPGKEVVLVADRSDGSTLEVPLRLRIDTNIEVEYYKHGGILPYVLRQLISKK
jgi:aconitate hydratase